MFFLHHLETPEAIELKLFYFKDISWAVTMATKLLKLPCRIWLHRKVKFLNNSVIYKDIQLKLGIESY